jgi:hypothetical protein
MALAPVVIALRLPLLASEAKRVGSESAEAVLAISEKFEATCEGVIRPVFAVVVGVEFLATSPGRSFSREAQCSRIE